LVTVDGQEVFDWAGYYGSNGCRKRSLLPVEWER